MAAHGKRPKARYNAERALLIGRGEWHPYADAAPVREHVRSVMAAAGLSRAQFAVMAGLTDGTVSKILYNGRPRVRTVVADRIMRVTTALPVPDAGMVTPDGSSRRLQALTTAGWPTTLLADRLGMDASAVRKIRGGSRQYVTAATARKIRAVYDELWNVAPPERNPGERIAAAKARAFAARHGWVPAAGWNDDQVDNPAARPAEGWQRPARKTRSSADTAAEARELFGFGLDRHQASRRLGVSRAALEKALERAGRAEREAVPA